MTMAGCGGGWGMRSGARAKTLALCQPTLPPNSASGWLIHPAVRKADSVDFCVAAGSSKMRIPPLLGHLVPFGSVHFNIQCLDAGAAQHCW